MPSSDPLTKGPDIQNHESHRVDVLNKVFSIAE